MDEDKDQTCYEKAKEKGEPTFTLRAQDKLAPYVIRAWASMAEQNGCPMEKVMEAYEKARLMEKWPSRKYPD